MQRSCWARSRCACFHARLCLPSHIYCHAWLRLLPCRAACSCAACVMMSAGCAGSHVMWRSPWIAGACLGSYQYAVCSPVTRLGPVPRGTPAHALTPPRSTLAEPARRCCMAGLLVPVRAHAARPWSVRRPHRVGELGCITILHQACIACAVVMHACMHAFHVRKWES